jgi:two-component system sensor histidine kinase and response regulator WspE
MQELDLFTGARRTVAALYFEVLRTRMRPFSDGVRRFPRMVRDLARSLKKRLNSKSRGENTQVDRDILSGSKRCSRTCCAMRSITAAKALKAADH